MKLYKLLFLAILLLGTVLRFYNIDINPPGLYIDEVSIGQNAYTLMKEGKDEYGKNFPLFFQAFGEYKMPVYIYSVSLSMLLFGKTELAVRFPSAFFGACSLVVFYFLITELIQSTHYKKRQGEVIALLSMFLLAISPWHINLSRGGFEATVALFFFLLAGLFFIHYSRKKKLGYLLACFSLLALTMYTYQAYRIISLLTIFGMLFFIFPIMKVNRKHVILSCIVILLLIMPMVQFTFSPEGSARFSQTSAFSEYDISDQSKKIMFYPLIFLKNYISYFSFHFLFNFGDGNGRHQLPGMGLFFRWEFPFLLLGAYHVLKNIKNSFSKWVLLALLIAPTAAAFARPSPHTLRSLLLVIPLTLLISIGLVEFLKTSKKWKIIVFSAVFIMALYEVLLYFHNYHFHYPKVNLYDWGAAKKQVVLRADSYKNKYEIVLLDKNIGIDPLYFNFYNSESMPIFIGPEIEIKKEWKGKKILYIRADYKEKNTKNIIDVIYLPNQNKDIYAQFIELQ